jgi:hypothetical protein
MGERAGIYIFTALILAIFVFYNLPQEVGATGYTGGNASGNLANLTIWDKTDFGMPFAGIVRYQTQQVTFFANYSNLTSALGESICQIWDSYNDNWDDMEFNSSSQLYEYSIDFADAGIYDWNASCEMDGYDSLNINDTVNITHNFAPNVTSAFVNSTSLRNDSYQNLTLWINLTDYENSNITFFGEWYRNGARFVNADWNNSYETYNGYANAITTDLSGNFYVAGSDFSNHLTIKYNSSWDTVWNATFDVSGSSEVNGLAVDSSGNVYVAVSVSDVSNYCAIAKYDSSGHLVWNATYFDGTSCYCYDIAVDSSENVYVAGTKYQGPSSQDIAIKYNSSGSYIWNSSSPNSPTTVKGIAVGPSGYIYSAGYYGPTGPTPSDYLTIKYNSSSGDIIWYKTYNYYSQSNDVAVKIQVDSSENIYVAGHSKSSGGKYYYRVIKYDSLGNRDLIWSFSYNNGGDCYLRGFAMDAVGNMYMTGYSDNGVGNDYLTVKASPQDGLMWNISDYRGQYKFAKDIAVDSSGGVYVAGEGPLFKYKDGFVKTSGPRGQVTLADTMDAKFTHPSDVWSVCAQAHDGTQASGEVCTNNITIDFEFNVTLLEPYVDYLISESEGEHNITFSCGAADEIILSNISLYLTDNKNMSLAFNQTQNLSEYSGNASWNVSLAMGNYTWNCLAYDSFGNSRWARGNRSILSHPDTNEIENLSGAYYACEGSSLSSKFNVTSFFASEVTITISPSDSQNPFVTSPTSASGNGTHSIEILSIGALTKSVVGMHVENISLVKSGICKDSKITNISVLEINNAPVLSDIPAQTALAGNLFSYTATVADSEDGNQASGNLTFNSTFLSGSTLFSVDNTTGNVLFTPSSGQIGSYVVQICVADKGFNATSLSSAYCNATNASLSMCKNMALTVKAAGAEDGSPPSSSGGGGGGGGGASVQKCYAGEKEIRAGKDLLINESQVCIIVIKSVEDSLTLQEIDREAKIARFVFTEWRTNATKEFDLKIGENITIKANGGNPRQLFLRLDAFVYEHRAQIFAASVEVPPEKKENYAEKNAAETLKERYNHLDAGEKDILIIFTIILSVLTVAGIASAIASIRRAKEFMKLKRGLAEEIKHFKV